MKSDYQERIPAGTVHYDDPSFRIFARSEKMRKTDHYHASLHWHDEIEIMHILNGHMYYSIDNKVFPVEKGDVIFVNSGHMHASFLKDSAESNFNIVLVHPSIYSSIPYVYQTMASPVLQDKYNPFFIVKNPEIAAVVDHMTDIMSVHAAGSQLALLAEAWKLMQLLYQRFLKEDRSLPAVSRKELDLLTKMAAFIYKHYPEKIFLKEIADSASVSISTCSRLFNHYLKKSPIDFLNAYRLEISSALLRTTDDPIGTISLNCGFDQQAYYSRMFKKAYGVTPAGYRRNPTDSFVH